jgi:hypothetical protein
LFVVFFSLGLLFIIHNKRLVTTKPSFSSLLHYYSPHPLVTSPSKPL